MEAPIPDDSGGNATRPPGNIPETGQTAQAPQVNVPVDDIYASLTRRYMRDGRAPMLGNVPMNGYKATGAANGTDPQDYVTKSQMDGAISAVSGFFPGFMQVDTVTSGGAPAGWLYANGQSVSRATFAALWARVQAGNNLAATQGVKTAGQYGPGDGSTTFTVPNLEADGGYFIRPVSSGRGIGTVQADEFKTHTHTANVSDPGHDHPYIAPLSGTVFFGANAGTAVLSTYTAATSPRVTGVSVSNVATGGTETRPKNIAYPVLIKT